MEFTDVINARETLLMKIDESKKPKPRTKKEIMPQTKSKKPIKSIKSNRVK